MSSASSYQRRTSASDSSTRASSACSRARAVGRHGPQHRVAGQRVDEGELAGLVLGHQPDRAGDLEVVEHLVDVARRDGREHLGPEPAADQRGREAQGVHRARRQGLEAAADDLADADRDVVPGVPEPGQLDDEERVAARAAVPARPSPRWSTCRGLTDRASSAASSRSRPARSSRSAWRRANASATRAAAPVGSGWARRVATTRSAASAGATSSTWRSVRSVASSAQWRSSSTTRTGPSAVADSSAPEIRSEVSNASRAALSPGSPAAPGRRATCRRRGLAAPAATATAVARRRPASSARGRRRTRVSAAYDATRSSSQDLPIPGSPTSRAAPACPVATRSTSSSRAACSSPPPDAGGRSRRRRGHGGRRARGGGRDGPQQGGVLPQDRLLQRLELLARVQPELVGEQLAYLAQRGQRSAWRPARVRASACRAHQRSWSGWADGRLGDRQQARVLAESQQAEDPGLLGRQA